MRQEVGEFLLQYGIGLTVYLLTGIAIGALNDRSSSKSGNDHVTFGFMIILVLLTSHCAGGGILRYFGR